MLREIRSKMQKRCVRCMNMIVILHDCSSRLNVIRNLIISFAQKQIQYSSKLIKTEKCKLRIGKPVKLKLNMLNYTNVFNLTY